MILISTVCITFSMQEKIYLENMSLLMLLFQSDYNIKQRWKDKMLIPPFQFFLISGMLLFACVLQYSCLVKTQNLFRLTSRTKCFFRKVAKSACYLFDRRVHWRCTFMNFELFSNIYFPEHFEVAVSVVSWSAKIGLCSTLTIIFKASPTF